MQAHVHCAYTSAAQKYSGFDYLVLVRPILCFFELDLQYIYYRESLWMVYLSPIYVALMLMVVTV